MSSIQKISNEYLSNYEKNWKGLGNITKVSREEFKKWIDSSTCKTKPLPNSNLLNQLKQ